MSQCSSITRLRVQKKGLEIWELLVEIITRMTSQSFGLMKYVKLFKDKISSFEVQYTTFSRYKLTVCKQCKWYTVYIFYNLYVYILCIETYRFWRFWFFSFDVYSLHCIIHEIFFKSVLCYTFFFSFVNLPEPFKSLSKGPFPCEFDS